MNQLKAKHDHPRLYALHQHTPVRLLGRLVDFTWNLPKHFKTHRKGRYPRAQRAYARRSYAPRASYRQHRAIVVHVYAGGRAFF